jgi:hypothetical protein
VTPNYPVVFALFGIPVLLMVVICLAASRKAPEKEKAKKN